MEVGGIPVKIKLSLTGALLLVSVMLAAMRGHPWHWLVCAALGVSWVGDAMLSRYWPVAGLVPDPFIGGMGAFAVAQVLYIIAFAKSLAGMPEIHLAYPGWITGLSLVDNLLPVYLLIGLMFWVWIVLRTDRDWTLKIGTLVYCCLVTAMAAVACAAAFTGVSIVWPLPLGGLLFIASDMVIAVHLFQEKIASEKRYEAIVWGTYFPAQLLLMLGASWLY